MGGAVSSGRDNNELIDNLMSGNYIRTKQIEMVFRALDRADYMTPEARDQAYKDLAWRNGPLHLSSPCIYSEVMEGLELKPGLSFLNIGSGTGYLSSLVGLILGTSGISHGVEVHPAVVEYATKKIGQFIENSPTLDEFDFCKPKYYHGNGLCLSPPDAGYDRVYCGAACPTEYEMYFKQLIKVGGLLVMPLNDTLLQVRRVAPDKWVSRCLLNVTFSPLRIPGADEATELVRLDTLCPVGLQLLSRAVVRTAMRGGVLRRHPELRLAPRPPPAACPRRICIPIEPGGSVEGLNVLHDLDNESGANEMNALLSLVISMGQNRVAGTLRYDRYEYASDDENEDDGDENEVDGDEDEDEDDGDENEVDGDEDEDDGDDDEDDDDDDDDEDDDDEDDSDENEDSRERGGEQAAGKAGAGKGTPRDDRPLAAHADDAPSGTRGTSGGPAEEERKHGARRRPRKAGYSPGRACPPQDAARKRRDPKPSTSHGPGSVGDVLRSTEERSKKETAIDVDRKTDKVTGPIRELPGVPSVVEIELGETSDMEWDGSAERLDHSDDDAAKIEPKRQKLDSGIGESPPGNSSPDRSKTDDPDAGDPAAADGVPVMNRSCSPGPEERAHTERRRRREARGGDARRVRLSLLMKQAVRELPLPHALKKFVNLGRCFEF